MKPHLFAFIKSCSNNCCNKTNPHQRIIHLIEIKHRWMWRRYVQCTQMLWVGDLDPTKKARAACDAWKLIIIAMKDCGAYNCKKIRRKAARAASHPAVSGLQPRNNSHLDRRHVLPLSLATCRHKVILIYFSWMAQGNSHIKYLDRRHVLPLSHATSSHKVKLIPLSFTINLCTRHCWVRGERGRKG